MPKFFFSNFNLFLDTAELKKQNEVAVFTASEQLSDFGFKHRLGAGSRKVRTQNLRFPEKRCQCLALLFFVQDRIAGCFEQTTASSGHFFSNKKEEASFFNVFVS